MQHARADQPQSPVVEAGDERPMNVIDFDHLEPLFPAWTKFTAAMHDFINNCCVFLSNKSAMNPKTCIGCIATLSLAILAIGFSTNFSVEVEYEVVYAPFGAAPTRHLKWIKGTIDEQYGFSARPRQFSILLHAGGDTVLTKKAMDRAFMAIDEVRNFQNYHDLCARSNFLDLNDNQYKCRILGPTRFWNDNRTAFLNTVETDADVIEALSAETFPDELPTTYDFILGNWEAIPNPNPVNTTNPLGITYDDITLVKAETIFQSIFLPDLDVEMDEYEENLLNHMLKVQQEWKDDPENAISLEFFTLQSYQLEFRRAILEDIKLVVVVALVMTTFTCLVFFKRDVLHSRTWLGVGSMTCITLSLITGYGLLFTVGIGFTNMTVLLPFVIYGVGLDDTFIITGEYFRTDTEKHPVVRMKETMQEVGSSIFLTTFTTTLAFALGCFSNIPSIRWLCIYACITVNIVFLYQITFFVAVVILDERRISFGHNDLVFSCWKEKEEKCAETEDGSLVFNPTYESEDHSQDVEVVDGEAHKELKEEDSYFADLLMKRYSDWLLRPSTKIGVLIFFFAYFALCVYRTSLMSQAFNISDFVPEDSYVKGFLEALDDYSEPSIELGVYFRDIDQMNSTIQTQMRSYIDDLAALDQIPSQPPYCWVVDFVEAQQQPDYPLAGFDFRFQVNFALQQPVINELYGSDIVRNNESDIIASRCWMYMKGVDLGVVEEQIEMLELQRQVSGEQDINNGLSFGTARFFTFTDLNFIWEFFAVAVEELINSTVAGVAAVCVAAFLLMPHWTALPCLFPLILMLYFDLIGSLQMLGLHINVVTYVCLVISIGLLVDFIMHVLLRYYESEGTTREEKVRETLRTMGASITIGGMSTFLAVIPLAFSVSNLVGTVFYAFFAMITIGVVHGLVFLPVVLSMAGPLRIPKMRQVLKEVKMPAESEMYKLPPRKDIPLADLLVVYEYKKGGEAETIETPITPPHAPRKSDARREIPEIPEDYSTDALPSLQPPKVQNRFVDKAADLELMRSTSETMMDIMSHSSDASSRYSKDGLNFESRSQSDLPARHKEGTYLDGANSTIQVSYQIPHLVQDSMVQNTRPEVAESDGLKVIHDGRREKQDEQVVGVTPKVDVKQFQLDRKEPTGSLLSGIYHIPSSYYTKSNHHVLVPAAPVPAPRHQPLHGSGDTMERLRREPSGSISPDADARERNHRKEPPGTLNRILDDDSSSFASRLSLARRYQEEEKQHRKQNQNVPISPTTGRMEPPAQITPPMKDRRSLNPRLFMPEMVDDTSSGISTINSSLDVSELHRQFEAQERRLADMQKMLHLQREQARMREKERMLEKTRIQLLEEKLKSFEYKSPPK